MMPETDGSVCDYERSLTATLDLGVMESLFYE